MIEADLRRARKTYRAIARGPLRSLLEWCATHALAPLVGREFDDATITAIDRVIDAAVADLADRGVFRYFGITDAVELGRCPIAVIVVDPEIGAVRVDATAAVEAILLGGATSEGWASPRNLTVADLER